MSEPIKILLADDDEFFIEMYAKKFRDAGFEVDFALSGESAIQKLQHNTYRAMLLDLVMEPIDGYEILSRIKKENLAPNTAVVVLSNLGQTDDIERGRSLGAVDYIVKAYSTPREVVDRVTHYLTQSV